MKNEMNAEEMFNRIMAVRGDDEAKRIAVKCFREFGGEIARFANRDGVNPCEEVDQGYWKYDEESLKAIADIQQEFMPRMVEWAQGHEESIKACKAFNPELPIGDNLISILGSYSDLAGKNGAWARYVSMLGFVA